MTPVTGKSGRSRGDIVVARIGKQAGITRLGKREMANAELVEGLCKGDPHAADVLYHRFSAMVYRRVWRILGADDESEDVAQQIFAEVLSAIGRLKNPEALDGWIAQVAFCTIRKELRRRRYRRLLFFSPEKPVESIADTDAEIQLLSRRALAIIKRMKPEDRMVFVMHFVDGESQREIAAAAGWSLSTAKRRIARARDSFIKRAKRDSLLAGFVAGGH